MGWWAGGLVGWWAGGVGGLVGLVGWWGWRAGGFVGWLVGWWVRGVGRLAGGAENDKIWIWLFIPKSEIRNPKSEIQKYKTSPFPPIIEWDRRGAGGSRCLIHKSVLQECVGVRWRLSEML